MAKKIRVILSKIGLDGHDRGIKMLARMFREAGMEVVYMGLYQTPENVVRAAVQEDADVIGLSILSGEHLTLVPKVTTLLKEQKLENEILLLVGGVVPREDVPVVKSHGVHEVFTAGSLVEEIVDYIHQWLNKKAKPEAIPKTTGAQQDCHACGSQ